MSPMNTQHHPTELDCDHANPRTNSPDENDQREREIEEKNQALDDILREAEKRCWNETPPLPS
jgi:hypothetical protein